MTKQKLFLKLVISSVFKRRSRMIVAVLAVAIGATILSGLVTIYYDIPRQLGKEFRSYGANLILLPQDDYRITMQDIEKVKALVGTERIVGIAPYRYQTIKINEQPYIIAGTDMAQAKNNSPFWHINGKWTIDSDEVMIGEEIANTLDLKVGDTFVVKGVKFGGEATASDQEKSAEENKKKDFGEDNFSEKMKVGGIITTGGSEEGFVFTDIDRVAKLIDSTNSSDVVECSIEANEQELEEISNLIAQNIPNLMARPVRRVTQSQDIVLNKLQALVYIVTVVVLIITMISVATTMMAMVVERRKEIGLKKALGALNDLIIKEFLGEAIMLGLIGGVLGLILGFIFAGQVSLSVFGRAIDFQWKLIPLTIISSVIVTAVASFLPIRRVLDVDPAIVLRGE